MHKNSEEKYYCIKCGNKACTYILSGDNWFHLYGKEEFRYFEQDQRNFLCKKCAIKNVLIFKLKNYICSESDKYMIKKYLK